MAKEKSKSKQRRYVLREQVGAGDYAKVFAVDDTKLGRQVAIKQLHSQYSDDAEKLDRYWREAQLLLDLEHPNIMTIYDLMKSRGCLVLELMKGNLRQIYGAHPMPVHEVREMLLQAARGLDCLHNHGIIHGDIKPANMMLSRQDVVKLGDFGLARRAADDDGSLLKGTTKYMAPELVSEDFGDVGPASDLYSLGFSALELMIGPEFDSLFPDLIAFGRDKQMAWMMWHCSADRQFPPIQSVLEGVPDDLANILQKLTAKNQRHRYRSAKELIDDLTGGSQPVGQSIRDEELAAEENARKFKRKRRFQALGACVASLILTTTILVLAREKTPPPTVAAPPPIRGVVQNVLPLDQKFVLDLGNDWQEFTVRDSDDVLLNRKKRQIRDLRIGDRVVVHTHLGSPNQRSHREFVGFRPETHSGVITDVDPEAKKVAIEVTSGDDQQQTFELNVSAETELILNQKIDHQGTPLKLDDLAKEDQVVVDLSDDESGMLALKIDALRLVELKGVIRRLSPRNGTVTVAQRLNDDDETLTTLPIDSKCVFTLNGTTSLDDQLLSVKNLQIGDRVTIRHDVKIQQMDAYRVFEDTGRMIEVDYDQNRFTLKSQHATTPRDYRIAESTRLLLGDHTVPLTALRTGDQIQLVHESPDDEAPVVLSILATRPLNRNKWAILIANQEFDSESIASRSTPIADVESIKSQLTGRFGVPDNQVTVYENEGRVRLESELPNLLKRVGADDLLYVFVATRGFNDKDRNAYLATREFDVEEMEQTGIGIDWLIDQIDSIPTQQKLLLLDCPTDGAGGDLAPVTGAEMLNLVRQNRRGGYPKSTYVLTSCAPGDRTMVAPDAPDVGLFAKSLSDAFSGKADQERDMDVEITELTTFVSDRVSSLATSHGKSQSPQLFIPDDTPPRLSDDARKSIFDLLARLGQKKLDPDLIRSEAETASRLAGGEPEPMLACGILLIKVGRINDALEILENIRLGHRGFLVADQAVVWIHFYKKHYRLGTAKLAEMLKQIPKPEKQDETYRQEDLDRFEWAGRLRELAGAATWSSRIPNPQDLQDCDQIVASHGDLPQQRYDAGRNHVRKIVAQFTEDLANDPESNAQLLRQRIGEYVPPIASPETISVIRQGMER